MKLSTIRRPRDDHLVNLPLLLYSYLQAGLTITGLCFLTYFLIFMKYGIPPSALPLTSDEYFIPGAKPFQFGDRIFSPDEQLAILAEVQSGFWVALVMCQSSGTSGCARHVSCCCLSITCATGL